MVEIAAFLVIVYFLWKALPYIFGILMLPIALLVWVDLAFTKWARGLAERRKQQIAEETTRIVNCYIPADRHWL